jgi:hypothetical protein
MRRLIPLFKPWGIKITITSAYRSREKQEALYADQVEAYPVAPPGTSQHEYGFAVDAVCDPRAAQNLLGELWAFCGYAWDISDPIHFEIFSREYWQYLMPALRIPAPQETQVSSFAPMQNLVATPATDFVSAKSGIPIMDIGPLPIVDLIQAQPGAEYSIPAPPPPPPPIYVAPEAPPSPAELPPQSFLPQVPLQPDQPTGYYPEASSELQQFVGPSEALMMEAYRNPPW